MPLEIACDESGYEGEKLIGTTTDVFAHGSVRLDAETAAAFIQQLRDRIRSPATHYKANHVLREKHRAVLKWLLGESSPLYGNGHVYLIDKTYYVLREITALLIPEVPNAAMTLYEHVLPHAFLDSANNLMRIKPTALDEFFDAIGEVPFAEQLRQARPKALAYREQLLADPAGITVMDPLIPAIVAAVAYWGRDGSEIAIVHDRQNMLSGDRIAHIKRLSGMHSLTLANSFVDYRVQAADVLGGAIRKLASDVLNGGGDPELTALMRPYIAEDSIWADDVSWSAIVRSPLGQGKPSAQ